MVLLFSHDLTQEQIKEANERFNIEEFIKLPEKLQQKWSNVPPEGEFTEIYFDDFKEFIEDNLRKGDFVLIQGDFGATAYMVNWAFKRALSLFMQQLLENMRITKGKTEALKIFIILNM
ncbi:CRISPR-associated protein Csx20 [Caloramator sp. Dgby_cultured_2]|uniref:CRISPR-associated protein Csx20 n=1 Tax=Caloramator sp. Dgby_cultured_2 TaxID=3029174 RepID=UPI00237E71C9|nr:CRISPR-associated protein Csx20 [Caloramator sp. Dgby_cultured_2]WDU84649.1 CRISPR-associated protein Csx20 [Caloramator sp. Dgby_cultured_2]